MKKIILFCLCLLCSLYVSKATPMMGVERVLWWEPDYLTVTWGGQITTDPNDKEARDIRAYIVSILDQPSDVDNSFFYRPTDVTIPLGSIVLAVDGMDAKGWSPERFYSVINQPHTHYLTLECLSRGRFEVEFGVGQLPAWMTASGFHPASCAWTRTSYNTPSSRFKIRMDKGVQWRKFKTFDYYFSSDDVLADKELIDKIVDELEDNGLRRDEVNPDVVFTVVKDASQSVEYTYVPETKERVQTGSVSTPVYGWKGAYLGSVTKNKYETVTSGGYTQKTASTNAYLEVDFLEASRLGEKTLPLIWQMKYTYNENTQANVDDLYSSAVTWVRWPVMELSQEQVSATRTRYFYDNIPIYDFGIVLNANAEVIGLDKYSSVVKKSGLQIGDRIVALDVTRSTSFKKGGGYRYGGSITVERGGAQRKLSFSNCLRTKNYGPIKYVSAYATR